LGSFGHKKAEPAIAAGSAFKTKSILGSLPSPENGFLLL
jgi:hypothetical protein